MGPYQQGLDLHGLCCVTVYTTHKTLKAKLQRSLAFVVYDVAEWDKVLMLYQLDTLELAYFFI